VKPEDTVPERIASELTQKLTIVEVSAMELLRYDDWWCRVLWVG